LEDDQFSIAVKLLNGFVEEKKLQSDDLLLLNGLPRHEGQATALEGILHVVAVINLECRTDVVWRRIRENRGGDRLAREDDHESAVAKKLLIYRERTSRLLDHYRSKGVKVLPVQVEVDTQSAAIAGQLEQMGTPDRREENHDAESQWGDDSSRGDRV
jgi:adenylate kinase family enzyme